MTSSIWPKTFPIASGLQSRRIKSLPRDGKPYPTLEKAAKIVEAMPLRNHLQKRQHAIFAIAFLGALRADTLISLRINRDPVASMASKHAVSEAFALACCNQAVTYTPQAAKHTIAAERNNRPLTSVQRKAWSKNMAPENDLTTNRHYGKMTDDRRREVLDTAPEKHDPMGALTWSDEDKIALVDAILSRTRQARRCLQT